MLKSLILKRSLKFGKREKRGGSRGKEKNLRFHFLHLRRVNFNVVNLTDLIAEFIRIFAVEL